MRIRTYLGLLTGFGIVVAASYLTYHNQETLQQPFHLGRTATLPLWLVLAGVFLLGFLPTLTLLVIDSVKRDLAERRRRRKGRAVESLNASLRRAMDFQADGQWERALDELQGVLGEQPEDFVALLQQGELLREQGRFDEAVEVHRRAAVHYPDSVALLYQLATDYEARGEAEVAREIRNRVLRDFSGLGVQVLRRRRNGALSEQRWDDANTLQDRITDLRGDSGSGAEHAQEAEVQIGLDYQRGVAMLEADEIAPAAALFRRILEHQPRFIPAGIMLGEVELLQDEEEKAIATWLMGFAETGSPVFLQRVEDHFIENAEPRRAIETLRQLIASSDNDLLPRFFLGRLYYRLEMHEEALKILLGLEDRIGSSPTYHFLLARIRRRRGETEQALDAYETCARELGVPEAEYRCQVCEVGYPEWYPRCQACGSWNSVELDFEEEHVSAEALGLTEGPILRIPVEWGPGDPIPQDAPSSELPAEAEDAPESGEPTEVQPET